MEDTTIDTTNGDGITYPDIRKNALHRAGATAFCLGLVGGLSLGTIPLWRFRNLNLYLFSLSVFHILEYYITARYNPGKVHSDSFLLKNGNGYMLAHTFAIAESLFELLIFPEWKSTLYSFNHFLVVVAGIGMIVVGQSVRTMAMYTAGQSFSHILKTEKLEDHKLVTHGVYQLSRHPSYWAFFWWALGTQCLLLNPISIVLFAAMLWKFFNDRIEVEEQYLLEFFGQDYEDYKKSVPVRIPFIVS